MITILLEEERTENRTGEKVNFQPCLEYFLQNKMMETFCLLGEKDVRITFWIMSLETCWHSKTDSSKC